MRRKNILFGIIFTFILLSIFSGCGKTLINKTTSSNNSKSEAKAINNSNSTSSSTSASNTTETKPSTTSSKVVPKITAEEKAQVDQKLGKAIDSINSSLNSIEDVNDIDLNSIK